MIMMFFLAGCQSSISVPDFDVSFFYLDSCGHCEAFKENAIPYLEKQFKNSIHITYYNMDEEASVAYYHQICDQLNNYDESLIDDVPLFVLDGYFAVLGYDKGEEKDLAKDIYQALNHQPLTRALELYRWEYKNEEN